MHLQMFAIVFIKIRFILNGSAAKTGFEFIYIMIINMKMVLGGY